MGSRWDDAVMTERVPAMPAVIEPETFGTEDEQAPPVVWTPTLAPMRGEESPEFVLRELEDGRLAMLVYSSPEEFAAGCGTRQPYVSIVAGAVQHFQQALGADVVLWDPVLDPALRQDGEPDAEGAADE